MVTRSHGTTVDRPCTTLRTWVTLGEFQPAIGRAHTSSSLSVTLSDSTPRSPYRRNYVTQDGLRRIMRDYFGYDVHFVQNITDIEDKVSRPSPGSMEPNLSSP